jgi:hypothetical protein
MLCHIITAQTGNLSVRVAEPLAVESTSQLQKQALSGSGSETRPHRQAAP